MRYFRTSLAIAVLAFVGLTPAAEAASVINSSVGLSGASTELDFSEVALPDNAAVTNEFAGFGVTFASPLVYNYQTTNFANITGDRLGNFFPLVNPFTINFAQDVTDATFAMVTNPGTSTFTALLNGAVVESFTTATTFNSASNFYGFTGILFDQITVNIGTDLMLLDNLAFNTAPPPPPPTAIPLPASGLMLLLALGGLTIAQRRKS